MLKRLLLFTALIALAILTLIITGWASDPWARVATGLVVIPLVWYEIIKKKKVHAPRTLAFLTAAFFVSAAVWIQGMWLADDMLNQMIYRQIPGSKLNTWIWNGIIAGLATVTFGFAARIAAEIKLTHDRRSAVSRK